MKLPIINLNGTSPSDLLEQQTEVLLSIRVALDKLYLAAPHGRDYPVEDSYWRAAREEHFARVAKMREIMLEVESIAEHCSNAVAARNEVRGGTPRRTLLGSFKSQWAPAASSKP